jgi:hypothetical protein
VNTDSANTDTANLTTTTTKDTEESVTAPVLPANDRTGDGYDWLDTLTGSPWKTQDTGGPHARICGRQALGPTAPALSPTRRDSSPRTGLPVPPGGSPRPAGMQRADPHTWPLWSAISE